jgi:hypothetical protein
MIVRSLQEIISTAYKREENILESVSNIILEIVLSLQIMRALY